MLTVVMAGRVHAHGRIYKISIHTAVIAINVITFVNGFSMGKDVNGKEPGKSDRERIPRLKRNQPKKKTKHICISLTLETSAEQI